jgi:hypothetical protein
MGLDMAEPGVTYFFGAHGLGGAALLQGWAEPEANHNWNDGLETTLAIQLPQRPGLIVLKVTGRPFLAPAVNHQDITLYMNGFRLGFWRLDRLENTQIEALIEPEFWLDRQGNAYGRLTWHLPQSTTPSRITGVEDSRQLGFCFQSFTLHRG